jgi:hypothetical protein
MSKYIKKELDIRDSRSTKEKRERIWENISPLKTIEKLDAIEQEEKKIRPSPSTLSRVLPVLPGSEKSITLYNKGFTLDTLDTLDRNWDRCVKYMNQFPEENAKVIEIIFADELVNWIQYGKIMENPEGTYRAV